MDLKFLVLSILVMVVLLTVIEEPWNPRTSYCTNVVLAQAQFGALSSSSTQWLRDQPPSIHWLLHPQGLPVLCFQPGEWGDQSDRLHGQTPHSCPQPRLHPVTWPHYLRVQPKQGPSLRAQEEQKMGLRSAGQSSHDVTNTEQVSEHGTYVIALGKAHSTCPTKCFRSFQKGQTLASPWISCVLPQYPWGPGSSLAGTRHHPPWPLRAHSYDTPHIHVENS